MDDSDLETLNKLNYLAKLDSKELHFPGSALSGFITSVVLYVLTCLQI